MIITTTKTKQVVGGKTLVITKTTSKKQVKDFIAEAADDVSQKIQSLLSSAVNNPQLKAAIGAFATAMKVATDAIKLFEKALQIYQIISFIVKDIALIAGAWLNPANIQVVIQDFLKIVFNFIQRQPTVIAKAILTYLENIVVSTSVNVEVQEINNAIVASAEETRQKAEINIQDDIITNQTQSLDGFESIVLPDDVETLKVTGWRVVEEGDSRIFSLTSRRKRFSIYGLEGSLNLPNTDLDQGIKGVEGVDFNYLEDNNEPFEESNLLPLPLDLTKPNFAFVLEDNRYYLYYDDDYYIEGADDKKTKSIIQQIKNSIISKNQNQVDKDMPDFTSIIDSTGIQEIDSDNYNELIDVYKTSVENVKEYVKNRVDELFDEAVDLEKIKDTINKIIKDHEGKLPNQNSNLNAKINSAVTGSISDSFNQFVEIDPNYRIEAARLFLENIIPFLREINTQFSLLVPDIITVDATQISSIVTSTETNGYEDYIDYLKSLYDANFISTITSAYADFDLVKELTIDQIKPEIFTENQLLRRLSSTNFYLRDTQLDYLITQFDSIYSSNKINTKRKLAAAISVVAIDFSSLSFNRNVFDEKKLKLVFDEVVLNYKNELIGSLNSLLDKDILFESFDKKYRVFNRVIYFINYIVEERLKSCLSGMGSQIDTIYSSNVGDPAGFTTDIINLIDSYKSISFHKISNYIKYEFEEQFNSIRSKLTDYHNRTTS